MLKSSLHTRSTRPLEQQEQKNKLAITHLKIGKRKLSQNKIKLDKIKIFKSKDDLPEPTRDRLIQVAKTLFARKGYDGTSVKDLCDAAGVNISLISYHFQGKEGLLRACLEQFGKARLAMAQRLLHAPQSVEELKLRFSMFIEEFLLGFLEEPEISLVMHRECEMHFSITEDIFRSSFLKIFETLVAFIKASQLKNLVRNELDPDVVGCLVLGSLVNIAQKDSLNLKFYGKTIKDPAYREVLAKNLIEIWLQGCLYSPTDSSSFSSFSMINRREQVQP